MTTDANSSPFGTSVEYRNHRVSQAYRLRMNFIHAVMERAATYRLQGNKILVFDGDGILTACFDKITSWQYNGMILVHGEPQCSMVLVSNLWLAMHNRLKKYCVDTTT